MRKRLTALAGCAVLLLAIVPLAATASNGQGTPNLGDSATAKACYAAKKADPDAFKALWGTHAMRECIRAGREAGGGARGVHEATNAAKDCRAEQATDPDAFVQTYGSNDNQRNAFGKCVSTHVEADQATS